MVWQTCFFKHFVFLFIAFCTLYRIIPSLIKKKCKNNYALCKIFKFPEMYRVKKENILKYDYTYAFLLHVGENRYIFLKAICYTFYTKMQTIISLPAYCFT